MIRIEDFGEIAYGGAVTLSEWWDNKRIADGKITNKDIFKKASFYTYLGIGLAATLISVFGWMKRWERWSEHVSHGFLYDLPRFAYNLSTSMGAASRGGAGSAAVQEAQRILQMRGAVPGHRSPMGVAQLAEGRATQRTYQPEMEQAIAF